jgi:hypothetical protein
MTNFASREYLVTTREIHDALATSTPSKIYRNNDWDDAPGTLTALALLHTADPLTLSGPNRLQCSAAKHKRIVEHLLFHLGVYSHVFELLEKLGLDALAEADDVDPI